MYAVVYVNYISIKLREKEYLEQDDKEHITFKEL